MPADRKIAVAVPIGMSLAWRGIGILMPGFAVCNNPSGFS
jgi:hypothetical protein